MPTARQVVEGQPWCSKKTSQGRRPNGGTQEADVALQTDAGSRRAGPGITRERSMATKARIAVCVWAYSIGDVNEDKEERARLTLISGVQRTSRERDSRTGRCEEAHSIVCDPLSAGYDGARAAMRSSILCRSIRKSGREDGHGTANSAISMP